MARALMKALASGGVRPHLASELRSRDGVGDASVQKEVNAQAQTETQRLIKTGRREGWKLWITYHNYYKAPDLLGPSVARALCVPYVQIESTRARKRLDGPWAAFAYKAEAAADAADAIFYFTKQDEEALRAYAPDGQVLAHLPPFLPRAELPAETDRSGSLLSVGMFRNGDKLASYRIIAETLKLLDRDDWHLEIAGDGPARDAVTALMQPFGARVRFLGTLDEEALQAAYERAKLYFWPGVNEAFGMSYLEAQATGLTVLAQDRPGARDVLAPGTAYPKPDAGASALATRLDMLLQSEKLAVKLGERARTHVAHHHLIGSTKARLRAGIDAVLAK